MDSVALPSGRTAASATHMAKRTPHFRSLCAITSNRSARFTACARDMQRLIRAGPREQALAWHKIHIPRMITTDDDWVSAASRGSVVGLWWLRTSGTSFASTAARGLSPFPIAG